MLCLHNGIARRTYSPVMVPVSASVSIDAFKKTHLLLTQLWTGQVSTWYGNVWRTIASYKHSVTYSRAYISKTVLYRWTQRLPLHTNKRLLDLWLHALTLHVWNRGHESRIIKWRLAPSNGARWTGELKWIALRFPWPPLSIGRSYIISLSFESRTVES